MPIDQNIQAVLGAEGEPGSVLFVLFIPSRTEDDETLPTGETQQGWANEAAEVLTNEFGGATAMPTSEVPQVSWTRS